MQASSVALHLGPDSVNSRRGFSNCLTKAEIDLKSQLSSPLRAAGV